MSFRLFLKEMRVLAFRLVSLAINFPYLRIKKAMKYIVSSILIIFLFFTQCMQGQHVGIGTVAPQFDLDVVGTTRVQYLEPGLGTGDPYKFYRFGSPSEYYAGFMYNLNAPGFGPGDNFAIFSYGSRPVVLRGGDIILQPNAGNVGIGTTSPDNRLDVNGTIRAKKIVVETGWSDYVFEHDYRLPTLQEEEQHIKTHGYLLGFESEEAMNGQADIGDVAKRQQAKIEELMLHVIELNKQIEALKSNQ